MAKGPRQFEPKQATSMGAYFSPGRPKTYDPAQIQAERDALAAQERAAEEAEALISAAPSQEVIDLREEGLTIVNPRHLTTERPVLEIAGKDADTRFHGLMRANAAHPEHTTKDRATNARLSGRIDRRHDDGRSGKNWKQRAISGSPAIDEKPLTDVFQR